MIWYLIITFRLSRHTGFSGASFVGVILRHIVEDPITLKAAMEASIKSTISTMSSRNTARITTKNFLNAVSAVVCRDPLVFLDAAANTCRITTGGANVYLAKQPVAEDDESEESNDKDKSDEPAATSASSASSSSTIIATEEKEAVYRNVFGVIISALTRPDSQPKTEDVKIESENSASASDSSIPPKETKVETPAHKKEKASEPPKAEFLPISTATLLQLIVDFVCSYPLFTNVILQHTFSPPLSSSSATSVPLDNIIAYLLEEFVPYTRPPSVVADDERVSDIIANEELVKHNSLATRLFVALCARPAGRERVVRELCTALRRKTSEGHTDSKYYTYIRCVVDLVCIITLKGPFNRKLFDDV